MSDEGFETRGELRHSEGQAEEAAEDTDVVIEGDLVVEGDLIVTPDHEGTADDDDAEGAGGGPGAFPTEAES